MNDFFVKWAKFTLVAVFGCGFLAMAIYAFVMRDEIRASQVEPPLIMAPEEAVKRRPEQPGGMEIPNRDKLVFDLLDNNSAPVQAVPLTEKPVTDEMVVASGTLVVESETQVAVVSATENSGVSEIKPETVALAAAVVKEKMQTPVTVEPVEKKVEVKPEPVKEKPEVKIVDKPTPKLKEEPKVASGNWAVQLAAVGSKADADKAVTKLKTNAALKGLKSRVVAAPDGKHFRIQFVGLKDRAAASKVCAKLQPCFPVAGK